MKKILAIVLTLVLLVSFGACQPANVETQQPTDTAGVSETPSTTPSTTLVPYEQRTVVKMGVLNGPTGMGMSKLMQDNKDKNTANQYIFEQFSAPADVMSLLINGELDIAAVPTNVASTLYNKTGGKVQMLAINTLGVLYVLSKDTTIKSIADLDGKTVYISGQGSTPEYAMDYILTQNDLKVGENVTLEFVADHASLVSMAVAGQAEVIVLPEPFVTTLLSKDIGYNVCIDLNSAWDEACNGESIFSMGAVVVRKDFAAENPEAVAAFMAEYALSVQYVNENVEQAAEIIASFGIVGSAEIAKQAIPNCKIVCISGEEMASKTAAFLTLLMDYNPKAIGGALPADDFYYEG